jgi:hypothetical protein
VTGWIKQLNEELHNLFPSPNVIRMIKSRRIRRAGHVVRMGRRHSYRVLVGKPEIERPLGRSRRRWMDNIRMDLGEIGWSGMAWIDLTLERDQWRAFVNMVMKL